GILPGLVHELALVEVPSLGHAYGMGGWIVLGVLALALVLGLYARRPEASLIGLLLMAMTVPALAAGPFKTQQANVSALWWGLGTPLGRLLLWPHRLANGASGSSGSDRSGACRLCSPRALAGLRFRGRAGDQLDRDRRPCLGLA